MSRLLLASALSIAAVHAYAQADAVNEVACGSLSNGGNGPDDYRTATPQRLSLVEGAHFTPDVEMLRKGNTSTISGDLDYTLRVFPNHHRALASLAKLQSREKRNQLNRMKWSVECYFERALRFTPDDAVVHQVYGYYLATHGRKNEALTQIEAASAMGGNNGNLHYNLGLLYFDLGEYDKSMEHARKAYELGFDLPGLKNKLVKAGKWKDAP